MSVPEILPTPTEGLYEALGSPEVIFEGGTVTYDDAQALMLLHIMRKQDRVVSSGQLLQFSDKNSPAERISQVQDLLWSAACDQTFAGKLSWQFPDERQVTVSLASVERAESKMANTVQQKSIEAPVPTIRQRESLFRIASDGSIVIPKSNLPVPARRSPRPKPMPASAPQVTTAPPTDEQPERPEPPRFRTVYDILMENARKRAEEAASAVAADPVVEEASRTELDTHPDVPAAAYANVAALLASRRDQVKQEIGDTSLATAPPEPHTAVKVPNRTKASQASKAPRKQRGTPRASSSHETPAVTQPERAPQSTEQETTPKPAPSENLYEFRPLPRAQTVRTSESELAPHGEYLPIVDLPSGISIKSNGQTSKLYFHGRHIRSHSEPIEVLGMIARHYNGLGIEELEDVVEWRFRNDPTASPLIRKSNLWWHLYAIGRVFSDNKLPGFINSTMCVFDENDNSVQKRQGKVRLDPYASVWDDIDSAAG